MASSVWRGNIAFGLVSIPVRLVRAARRERTRFHHVYREPAIEPVNPAFEAKPGSKTKPAAFVRSEPDDPAEASQPVTEESGPLQRVRHVPVTAAAQEEITPDVAPAARVRSEQILKGYEIAPNRYVTFQPSEVKAIKPDTSTAIDLASFIHVAEIDPIYFDQSYYVVPQPAGEKPYAILYASLRHTGYAGMGEMAMFGREHSVVIRPGEKGLILDTLFFENEVHAEDQFATNPSLANAAELKMADAFIKALAGTFNAAELVDKYEKRLQALIEKRSASAQAAAVIEPAMAQAPVVDIMEALRQSLEQVRKPAASAGRAATAKRSGTRRHAS